MRALFGYVFGGREQLLAAFDGARASHHDKAAVADRNIANLDDRLFFADFFTDQFEGLQDRESIFNAVGGFDVFDVFFFIARADSGDDGAFYSIPIYQKPH